MKNEYILRFWLRSIDFHVLAASGNWSNWRFSSISFRMNGKNGMKSDMLMYPYHLQNWLDFGHGLFLASLLTSQNWFIETRQIWGARAFFPEHTRGMRTCNLTCLCILTTSTTDSIRFWSSSVDFPTFDATFIKWNWSNWGFPGISEYPNILVLQFWYILR